ncbi:MAG: copper homeostasis protein CutC [Bacteroidales bacterium]|nr:copper homeostasis protein CutC [Bacteroidales bacterium]
MLLEVCCGNLDSVKAAVEGGAPRVELCSRLDLDGLTPLWDELREARRLFPTLKIHALIRPRDGDFCYCPEEMAQIAADIQTALDLGADGIVVGALTEKGDVDREALESILPKGPALTFHRAFDVCRRPFEALKVIEELGFHRILTSGQAPSAQEGTDLLRELQARTPLTILPGGGINAFNARRILELTGCRELHASASTLRPDGRKVSDAKKIAAILAAIR